MSPFDAGYSRYGLIASLGRLLVAPPRAGDPQLLISNYNRCNTSQKHFMCIYTIELTDLL